MPIRALAVALLALIVSPALARTQWPNQREADFLLKDFRFASGEMSDLKLHYTTLGTPERNAAGDITNAVILLHGTSSTGKAWLMPSLADELFAPGAALDATRYFIVLPDGLGRGGSSKPSDGLRAKFPHYRYRDIVETEHRMLTEGLNVRHLRLVLGSSMGGMHTWMWGYTYPDLMDGLIPIASQPIESDGDRLWIRPHDKTGFAVAHDLQHAAGIFNADHGLCGRKSLHGYVSQGILVDRQISASKCSIGKRCDLIARAIAEPKLDSAAQLMHRD